MYPICMYTSLGKHGQKKKNPKKQQQNKERTCTPITDFAQGCFDLYLGSRKLV